jgi:hypothetical protein
MSKTNAYELSLLQNTFNNSNIALVGDATGIRGSTTAGSLYVSLHTADPGEAGSQTTSEATFTSYARVAVARNAGGWTVSGNQVSNTAQINFPACTGGSNLITHFGVGTDASGAGLLLYKGALTPSITISNGITASIALGGLIVTEE